MKDINKKTIAILACGSGFEYYDFVIYALFINTISCKFFDSGDATHALLWAVALFATGYLARPLGGIFFGMLGDKYGRKPALFMAMLLMAGATLVMGLAPGYATVGIFGTAVFAGARFLQGLSYGAEMPGALVYVAESSVASRRSRSCAQMLTGACLGATLATLVYWLSVKFMSAVALAYWGWRLPFLFGAVLALVALVFRAKLLETAEFVKTERRPWLEAVRALSPAKLSLGFCAMLFPAAFVLLTTLFLPVYILQTRSPIALADVSLALFIGNLWSAFLLFNIGALVDRCDRYKLFRRLLWLIVALNPLLFELLHLQTLAGLYIFIMFNQTMLAFIAPTYMVFLPETFAPRGRLTAVGLVYNSAYGVAAFVPALLAILENFSIGGMSGGLLLFELLALISIMACQRLQRSANKRLSL